MRFGFHPEARSEYKEATAFYEAQSRGLGNEFVQEIEATIKKIIQSPEQWRFIEQDVRRSLTHIFPYAILYTLEKDYILIVAVAHCSRQPGYWRERIKKSG